MDRYDFAVIGAGAAGEAAAHLARERGASVAIVDSDLYGGSCAFWACMPSKALLHAAAVHRNGGDYPWGRASAFRDWIIDREERDYPDDSSHRRALETAGAVVLPGRGRLAGSGRVTVEHDGRRQGIEAEHVIIAVGSGSRIPPIRGLDTIDPWTNVQATSIRELPRSFLVLGGGPTGVELAQAYARYGVPTTVVDSNDRVRSREHPRNSEAVRAGLERDGVIVRTGVRADAAERNAGRDGAHRMILSDGSAVEGHAVLIAIGRAFPLADLGLDTVGVEVSEDGPLRPDADLRIADEVYLVGDPAGPEMHTHLAHYEGEMAVRIALGDPVRPDFTAIPRATYTDPETASVGLRLDEANKQGHDAMELTEDLATTAKGYVAEAAGHVTIVVDRRERVLLGAFIAGPAASETIHEAVLAVKLRTPLDVLADTLHAFPTVARVLGTTFGKALKELT